MTIPMPTLASLNPMAICAKAQADVANAVKSAESQVTSGLKNLTSVGNIGKEFSTEMTALKKTAINDIETPGAIQKAYSSTGTALKADVGDIENLGGFAQKEAGAAVASAEAAASKALSSLENELASLNPFAKATTTVEKLYFVLVKPDITKLKKSVYCMLLYYFQKSN